MEYRFTVPTSGGGVVGLTTEHVGMSAHFLTRGECRGIARQDRSVFIRGASGSDSQVGDVIMADRRQAGENERELARQMLAHAAGNNQTLEGLAAATDRVFGNLYQRLKGLIGLAGYDALLQRALYLARAGSPILGNVKVAMSPDDVSLEGLQASVRDQDPAVVREGLVSVLAQFIWLLITFVGETLALRLIHEAWPEAAGSGSEENSG
jgi:hypothetical protein